MILLVAKKFIGVTKKLIRIGAQMLEMSRVRTSMRSTMSEIR